MGLRDTEGFKNDWETFRNVVNNTIDLTRFNPYDVLDGLGWRCTDHTMWSHKSLININENARVWIKYKLEDYGATLEDFKISTIEDTEPIRITPEDIVAIGIMLKNELLVAKYRNTYPTPKTISNEPDEFDNEYTLEFHNN